MTRRRPRAQTSEDDEDDLSALVVRRCALCDALTLRETFCDACAALQARYAGGDAR